MSGQGGSAVSRKDILRMTVRVATAFMKQNPIEAEAVPNLISTVHQSLAELSVPAEMANRTCRKPAVSVAKSVAPNYIVCLEDGRRLKMLKRHLKAAYGLSPEENRQRWNLPTDYPMVAPDYAQLRSQFAKKMGLGKHRTVKSPVKSPVKS